MIFQSKYGIGQPVGFISNKEEKIALIQAVLFTKDGVIYELDNDDCLEESRVTCVYTKSNAIETVEEPGVAHV